MGKPVIVVAGAAARALSLERSLLSLHAPEFHTADDGREVLRLVLEHRPRLVVVADELEGISGAELVKRMKQHSELRAIPVMLLDPRGGVAFPQPGSQDSTGTSDRDALVMLADKLISARPRARARAPVAVGRAVEGKVESLYAQSVDFSESGMLLEAPEGLAVGETLQLHFVLPGLPDLVKSEARVVRLESGRRPRAKGNRVYGVEFTTLLPRHQLVIRRYMRSQPATP